MKFNRKEKISAIVGSILGVIIGLSLAAATTPVVAHNNCEWNCHTSTPSPTPTSSPKPECEDNCDVPTASPSATPVETTEPSQEPTETASITAAAAPQLPSCSVPGWIPVVIYDGQVGDTFSYHWTYPDNSVTTFWVKWGDSKYNTPYSEVVGEKSVSITMYGQHTNWISVAAYNQGCLGVFSPVIN